ncbi:MAG: hypothetical protein PF450_01990 [Bacteroidales bacterium]|jgi:hypothetical protein|nr:hypothetical protein [Bacteroidales bacterium]
MKVLLPLLSLMMFSCSSQRISETRNVYEWPFSDTSIWNMSIGFDAVYVHAQIETATMAGMTIDEDILFLDPEAPLQDVFFNPSGWNREIDRCDPYDSVLLTIPLDKSFIVGPNTWDGITPNSGVAAILKDGKTLVQTQPFAQCEEGIATSKFTIKPMDIYGEGMYGAHGGSGLSAIGGTLRLGELDETTDVIRHALKVNIFAGKNIYYDENTMGYRWPAIRSDGYARNRYYKKRTGHIVEECRMGALLALPQYMDLDTLGLETIPARILAEAFQNYGAYIVDDTAWDVYALITEWSPNGRVSDEFEEAWGFSMIQKDQNTPWARDMDRIFLNLHVVDNNSPNSKGGGGEPLRPLAPPTAR